MMVKLYLFKCCRSCVFNFIGIVLKCWFKMSSLGLLIIVVVSLSNKNFNGCSGVFNMDILVCKFFGKLFIILVIFIFLSVVWIFVMVVWGCVNFK